MLTELAAALGGFLSAHIGRSQETNPFLEESLREAWESGWRSYHERFFPPTAELRMRVRIGGLKTDRIVAEFVVTGKLPDEVAFAFVPEGAPVPEPRSLTEAVALLA